MSKTNSLGKVQLHGQYFTPFIEASQIQAKIQEIAAQIAQDFATSAEPPVLLVVLKGAFRFAADLVAAAPLALRLEFLRVASYEGTERQEGQQTLLELSADLRGSSVIIIEDIVDTGLTLQYLRNMLANYAPAQLKVASLLAKPSAYQVPVTIDYLGFEIDDRFVVGYGLDYDQLGRELNDIYVIQE